MVYDVIVIGAGPAGLAAGIYGKRAGLNILILDTSSISGGQILSTYEIDNYPGMPGVSGTELAEDMRSHCEQLGVEFARGRVTAINELDGNKELITKKENFYSKTVVVATGASNTKLGCPGEDDFSGLGVSYCATCDGAFFKNKEVAVVGGGDTACEEAIYLAQLCKKVYMIVRKPFLRASDVMQRRVLENEKIEVLFEHNTLGLYGENGVEGAHVVRRKGEPDEERYDLPIDGFFLAIGHKPNTDIFRGQIAMDETGYIRTLAGTPRVLSAANPEETVPGVFAAGDCADPHYRQAIVAAGSGCMAALEAERFLQTL